jgi:SAM-dependent methyltransferase
MSTPNLREAVKRYVPLACAAYIASDLLNRLRFSLGSFGTRSGAVHLDKDIEESIAYIERVFASYKMMAGVERFSGRVAEIGPGDNSGVALLFRRDGCERVDMLDKFYSARDDKQQAAIYRALFDRNPGLADRVGHAGDGAEFAGVERHTGPAAEAEKFFRTHDSYDYIVSCAVLEHLQDPLNALRDMAAALREGGMMLHAVDLRDHGMFSGSHDDTKFFEIPAPVYSQMTRGSGRPNRVSYSSYRSAAASLPLQASFYIGSLFGETSTSEYVPFDELEPGRKQRAVELIESRKHRFARELRRLPTEDLMISSFFLVGRRTS